MYAQRNVGPDMQSVVKRMKRNLRQRELSGYPVSLFNQRFEATSQEGLPERPTVDSQVNVDLVEEGRGEVGKVGVKMDSQLLRSTHAI